MNVVELLVGGVVGAIIGVVFERATSFFGSIAVTLRYWRLRGTYEIRRLDGQSGGFFIITPRLGNRFLTEGWDSGRLWWRGVFQFDDLSGQSARGVYRYVSAASKHPLVDWGNHLLMLLDDGDFVVQWHNVSHARDNKGAYTLHRLSKSLLRGAELPSGTQEIGASVEPALPADAATPCSMYDDYGG